MAKQAKPDEPKERKSVKFAGIYLVLDPYECPFREFRDSELGAEFWGLGPGAHRALLMVPKVSSKPMTPAAPGHVWIDDQTQPLPRSVRQYLHGWIRAEELALARWEAEAVVCEETTAKMSVIDWQVSHAQVLLRSSFCRKVLSLCFILERTEGLMIEHLSDSFSFSFGPEGWRAKYHIYSPGMKYGGGSQHKPVVSKNGCYLVRLYYLGAWRCVWVSDLVPVDTSGAPLLPFSPLMYHTTSKVRGPPTTVTSHFVHIWPLLLCKAILKLAAPDMSADDEPEQELEPENVEDELMTEIDILHTLTGGLSMVYLHEDFSNKDILWEAIKAEVPIYTWDDDDETVTSTVKSTTKKTPSMKKTAAKEFAAKRAIVTILLHETMTLPPYAVAGITPAHELDLLITVVRDVPLKKPLPEPIVPLWKTYRWVDWARQHGLYDAYECPRTQFLKLNGLLKLSGAPHLLDVQSTASITAVFREEHEKTDNKKKKDKDKDKDKEEEKPSNTELLRQKEELREWVPYTPIYMLLKNLNILYFPSGFEFASCTSIPSQRSALKAPTQKLIDILQPKSAPLYVSIDSPEKFILRISVNVIHPRVLSNAGVLITDHMEKTYVLLEEFEWFIDKEIGTPKAFVETRGYNSVGITFEPGRHFCRLWIHSRMNWHVALISDATFLLGTRDTIQSASIKECPWVHKFFNYLSNGFLNWVKAPRMNGNILMIDREFFSCYQPDLEWDPKVVGYPKCFVHWMFRQALQSLLFKRLPSHDFQYVCNTLRRSFMDPDFGFPSKPPLPICLRQLADQDPCDCTTPDYEYFGEEVPIPYATPNVDEQEVEGNEEEIPLVPSKIMSGLLKPPQYPTTSNLCDFATEEIPCATLRREREKTISKHRAATFLQARWRGWWARKILSQPFPVSSDVLKIIMDNSFGNLDGLSHLMAEFFNLYPGTRTAYSISRALSGLAYLQQHSGTSPISAACKWIPYFQGVFYCHFPVKVHFDVHSTLKYSTVAVYDNDTGEQMPQAYNAHVTFDFVPNMFGYTVMGHGSLKKPTGIATETNWQLTILSSIDNVFHICDNPETDLCTLSPLTPSSKLHLEEFFVPNRRNILGGVQISVTKIEAVSFRAEATSPDLEMEAILRTVTEGEVEELGRCHGTGEICWPYLRLKAAPPPNAEHHKSYSHAHLLSANSQVTIRPTKGKSKPSSAGKGERNKSITKLKDVKPVPIETKMYTIEVIATNGWALAVDQWQRVIEVRSAIEAIKIETSPKKGKPGSAAKKEKDKDKEKKDKEDERDRTLLTAPIPIQGDAFTVLECATAMGGGAVTKRDEERDLLFLLERRSWETKEPGRNARGEKIRKDFKEAFLLPDAMVSPTTMDDTVEEEDQSYSTKSGPRPSPATESVLVDVEVEPEEESVYFTIPDKLSDKFEPLYFVQLCTKSTENEESVILTQNMAEAAHRERQMHLDAAVERMHELQAFNQKYVIGRQQYRCNLLEKLFVDSHWGPDLATALEERDEAIAREILERTLSAAKKKADSKSLGGRSVKEFKPAGGKNK